MNTRSYPGWVKERLRRFGLSGEELAAFSYAVEDLAKDHEFSQWSDALEWFWLRDFEENPSRQPSGFSSLEYDWLFNGEEPIDIEGDDDPDPETVYGVNWEKVKDGEPIFYDELPFEESSDPESDLRYLQDQVRGWHDED